MAWASTCILLRERGWRVVGVDWSHPALQRRRRTAAVPLAAMDCGALAARDGVFAAYVSLGVVEHDPAGPDVILAEAGACSRAAAPRSSRCRISTASVVSGTLSRRPEPRHRAKRRPFYQYAFSRASWWPALAGTAS